MRFTLSAIVNRGVQSSAKAGPAVNSLPKNSSRKTQAEKLKPKNSSFVSGHRFSDAASAPGC
jgi:hypothetical protein